MFVMMLHAFTNPNLLWAKLMQRFNVPDGVPKDTAQKIRMRVCVFIKNWVETEETTTRMIKGLIQVRNFDPFSFLSVHEGLLLATE